MQLCRNSHSPGTLLAARCRPRSLLVDFGCCFPPPQCEVHSSGHIADGKPWVMSAQCPMMPFSLHDGLGLWSLLISSGQLRWSHLAGLRISTYGIAAMRLGGWLKLRGSHHMLSVCKDVRWSGHKNCSACALQSLFRISPQALVWKNKNGSEYTKGQNWSKFTCNGLIGYYNMTYTQAV